MSKLTKIHLEKMVTIKGLEHLDIVLQDGKGAIIQLAHFGSFLLILPALGFLGYPINQLAGKPEVEFQRPIYKWIFELRKEDYAALPINFIHVDQSIRPVINALKRNELVAMALDGRDGNDFTTVQFMGRSANFLTGSLRLASVTGAQILPTFIVRQPDDSYRLTIEKPFVLEQYDNKHELLNKNMERLVALFEKYIIKYPDHFMMTIKVMSDKQKQGTDIVSLFNNFR
jgi:KDO2-lipid IV(A) lauroyltransferase